MWTGRYPNLWKRASSALVAWGLWAAVAPIQVPSGTELHIRLQSKLASNTAKVKDTVQAQVIAPVVVNGQFLVPAGTVVNGVVEAVKASTKPEERASLKVNFNEIELNGKKLKMAAKLAAVDNARESVDAEGQIQGILASESISARIDSGIGKVAERFGGLAEVLGAAKGAMLKTTEADIDYGPGVEMDLTLTTPLMLDKVPGAGAEAKLESLTDDELVKLAVSQPFQTTAEKPPKPSDLTNIMIVGTQEQMEAVFKAAGWSTAAALSAHSKLETFRAIAEDRGYKEAPVSILLLEGQPPDQHLRQAPSPARVEAPGDLSRPPGVGDRGHARHGHRFFSGEPHLHPQGGYADRPRARQGGE